MAEERLIDADKDKKYRIRKNADGEDELYLATDEDGAEEEFEVPVFAFDDEDAAAMSPEEFKIRKEQEERVAKQREEQLQEHRTLALEAYAQGKLDKAVFEAENVLALDVTAGDMLCLKMRVLIQQNGVGNLDDALCADVEAFATDEQKAELKGELSGQYQQAIAALQEKLAPMERQAEAERAERRVIFKANQKRAVITFACVTFPLVVFAVLTAVFGSVMFSAKQSYYPVLTAIFGALTGVAFIADVFIARWLVDANRTVTKNESNKYTKLGRAIIELQTQKQKLETEAQAFAVSKTKESL